MPPKPEPELLSTSGLAARLNVSERTVQRMVDEGLPHFRVRGQLRFSLPDVLEALKAEKPAGAAK